MGRLAMSDAKASNHWTGRSALVTGAGGFVGSWLAKALVDRGADVTVILRDQPHNSNFDNLGLGSTVNVVPGSITDLPIVERAMNEYTVDAVFHLAAQAMVGVANRAPLSTFESNIRGTWNVLEAARTTSSVTAVVVASSDKAYGSQAQLPYVESAPLLARSPYDVSKACTDLLAATYHHTYGLPATTARCANVYGGGDLNFSRLVPGTIRSALEGTQPLIRSNGTPVRDYLYIDDAVDAYLTLGQSAGTDGVAGSAFNFGMNAPVSVMDLVAQILSACERTDLEPIVQDAVQPGAEIDRQYLDSSRAQQVLGWRPATSLGDGLSAAAAWYREYLEAA
jgi:CDP-glucose 4,6-dehydratase